MSAVALFDWLCSRFLCRLKVTFLNLGAEFKCVQMIYCSFLIGWLVGVAHEILQLCHCLDSLDSLTTPKWRILSCRRHGNCYILS